MNSSEIPTQAVALLGRRDEPTDGVEDYSTCLAGGLARRGWALESVRVPWPQGWFGALRWLSQEAKPWNRRWVLVQYTALGWSRRALPLGLLGVLWMLRRRGARCVMIFHDTPYAGHRRIDWLRRNVQLLVMRTAYRISEHSIFNMVLDKVNWLPPSHEKAVFIPVGANIPSLDDLAQRGSGPEQRSPAMAGAPSLAVFGVSTWPSAQKQEIGDIIHAAREASARLGELRLLVLGRGALEVEAALREGLAGTRVTVTVYGVLDSREVSARLLECDVLLFVRGPFSTRRGSGIAALACGLPLVAYQGEETAFPLHDGGIVFVPQNNLSLLADEVTRVLKDSNLRESLRARNQDLYREWFSWDSIADRVISALTGN